MDKRPATSGPQFRSDRPAEQPAVRTTIVGGRPPGSGQGIGEIPRGIEVLLKKAAVDPVFRDLLLTRRAEAADEIGLTLDPAEVMMLGAVPAAQLETIIAGTTVPQEHRRAFLGKAAAAMLAAVGVIGAGCGREEVKGTRPDGGTKGSRPDRIPAPTGSAPDRPPEKPQPPAEGADPTVSEPADPEATEGQADPEPSEEQPEPIVRGIRPDRVPKRPDRPPAPTGIRPE